MAGERAVHETGRQRGHAPTVAQLDEPGGDRDVGDGEDVAAEDQRLPR
jgi:hypothetical protein